MLTPKSRLALTSSLLFLGTFLILTLLAGTISSTPVQAAPIDYSYENPIQVNSFSGWLSNLLANIQGVVGWIAVILIAIGGLVYITSGGSQGQVTLGKTIITWALVGFALVVAAPSLLKEVYAIAKGDAAISGITDQRSVLDMLTGILNFILLLIGSLSLISFTLGGFFYVTAAGDYSRQNKAKDIIVYSIIALVVSGSGIIVVKQVFNVLSAGGGS